MVFFILSIKKYMHKTEPACFVGFLLDMSGERCQSGLRDQTIIRDNVKVDRVACIACTHEGLHAAFLVWLFTDIVQDTTMGTVARRPAGIFSNT